MAERVQSLVSTFEGTANDFTIFVEGLTDAQWNTLVANDERTVGVVAHHVADSLITTAQATLVLTKSQPFPVTWEMINQGNAHHAIENAHASHADTIALLRKNIPISAGVIKALQDADLDNTGEVALFGGQQVPAHVLANQVWVGHITGHLANIKAALA